jgi:hypothetical protein
METYKAVVYNDINFENMGYVVTDIPTELVEAIDNIPLGSEWLKLPVMIDSKDNSVILGFMYNKCRIEGYITPKYKVTISRLV